MEKMLPSHGHRPFNAPWDGTWGSIMSLTDEKAEFLLGDTIMSKDFRVISVYNETVTALYRRDFDWLLITTDNTRICDFCADNIKYSSSLKPREIYDALQKIANDVHWSRMSEPAQASG